MQEENENDGLSRAPDSAADGDDPEYRALVRALDDVLLDAVAHEVEEIHIDQAGAGVLVRFRGAGGALQERQAPAFAASAIFARLKIMANLDISERRMPQNGRMQLGIGGARLDAMVATLPTVRGERVILRLQPRRAGAATLAECGAGEALVAAARAALARNGALIVAGSAPRDRSELMQTLLREVDTRGRLAVVVGEGVPQVADERVLVVEPYRLTGFGGTLRALARHRPDVVLLDRTLDAAELTQALAIARDGAVLVCWTAASDPCAALASLANAKLRGEDLAELLALVLTEQRFTRLCAHCRRRSGAGWDAPGCDRCLGGRKGEVRVHRALAIGEALRRLIGEGRLEHPAFGEEERRLCGAPAERIRRLAEAGEISPSDLPG